MRRTIFAIVCTLFCLNITACFDEKTLAVESQQQRSIISTSGGTASLNGALTITFTPSSFTKKTTVSISKSNSQASHLLFDEMAAIFRPKSRSEYELIITTDTPPATPAVINVSIPPEVTITEGYGYEIFARTIQNGGQEIIESFGIIKSTYAKDTHSLIATVPPYFFISQHADEKKFGLILVIATTPSENTDKTQ